MLHTFLTAHRTELVARCSDKVAVRSAAGTWAAALPNGVAIFLDQLIETLELEDGPHPELGIKISGPASGIPTLSDIGRRATQHGSELLAHGYSIEGVVHDYGDLCQAITDMAFEADEPITASEFRTLNRCLDNAMATAVTEFAYARERVASESTRHALNEHLGAFAHELRNSLSTATLAINLIRRGQVGHAGATGAVLDRSLVQMRNLIDRSLAEARLAAGPLLDTSVFPLGRFIAEAHAAASLEANVRERSLIVPGVDPALSVSGDRDLLLAALGNLLNNAFKFTPVDGEVTLSAYALGERIHIDVEDRCGGLADGVAEVMFKPFAQMGEDRSGIGLGLSIARRGVEANGGTLSVRNVPGVGCVLTIDLPRHQQSAPAGTNEREPLAAGVH